MAIVQSSLTSVGSHKIHILFEAIYLTGKVEGDDKCLLDNEK
jgi:hypothetical protein